MAESPCSTVKHRKGKILASGEKIIVLNVSNKYREKYPTLEIIQVEALTSEFTGVSVSSIERSRAEKKTYGAVYTPNKKRKHAKPVLDKFDDFNKNSIRSKVHSFFFKNELPTLNKVISAFKSYPYLPIISRASLHKLLLSMNFKCVGKSRNSFIIDRDDIKIWRRKCLKHIKEFRKMGKKTYTWMQLR